LVEAAGARRPPPALLVIGALGLGVLIGRSTAPPAPTEPPAESEPKPQASKTSTPSVGAAWAARATLSTSSTALCPCPKPRPLTPVLALARKQVPPVATPPLKERDPTARTAAYLRDQAQRFSRCAPTSGERLRVHLEIRVEPGGQMSCFKITNLEPLPPGVSVCLEAVAHELSPPGFDAHDPEDFALTVVL
jgi:hypothetical protein